MDKILIMTDLHVTKAGQDIIGLDPLERLRAALDHAAARHGDATRLMLMGDLTHFGSRAEYQRLRDVLDDLPWPVTMTLGNHDHRAGFGEVFGDQHSDPNGFVQSVVDLGDARLIMLDTLDEDGPVRHAGLLCADRLAFLRSALATDRPCYVFLHHPPFNTGFDGMDAIGLRNAPQVRDVLREGGCTHVFGGHVHRTIHATVDGLPMSVFKSPCHQMPMLLGAAGSSHSVAEPGGYGIALIDGGNVVVHVEDVLEGFEATVDGHSA